MQQYNGQTRSLFTEETQKWHCLARINVHVHEVVKTAVTLLFFECYVQPCQLL